MGGEILAVLERFGGGGADPGDNAVRFLLAAFFWFALAVVSDRERRRSGSRRDLYVELASLIGLSRELLMFFLEYGAFRGFAPVVLSFRVFPPLEHALTGFSRCVLGFSYLYYFQADRRPARVLLKVGLAAFALLYVVTALAWPLFLDAHSRLYGEPNPRFGLFWGDAAFRLAGTAWLGTALFFFVRERRRGGRVSVLVVGAFFCLFLDEFLMIFNLATGDGPYRALLAPLRHNLGIWAIPMFLFGYWNELFERLADEKEKTEKILEAMGDAIELRSDSGGVVYRNAAYRELFGAGAQDSPPPPDGVRVVGTTRGPRELEYSSFPLPGGVGKAAATITVARDVTEKNRAAEELRVSEERYRTLIDNIDLGITLIDRDYRIKMVNRKQATTFHMTPADFPGRSCHEMFEKRGEVCSHCPGSVAMRTGLPASVELSNEIPELGMQDFRIQAFPLLNGEGEAAGFIELVENVTELKRGREERERLEARLTQNQKLESLGILAGGIAHDFNNLLMGIVGNIDLALMHTAPESPVRPYLQRIDTTAQRAADLTNQMLAYSGKGRFVVEPINVSRLVEEMGHLLETVINKKAVLKYHLAGDLPPVDADATQIRQVVMNLITNASDAIGERSGAIAITTALLEADASYFNSMQLDDGLPSGFYVCLEVADTGAGMDRETQARIFDPFFTTKHTGRGLGLAAVTGIVRGHKGALKVYSEPGLGTTFKVLFPVSASAARGAKDETSPHAHASRALGEARTVLVVDDDETVLANARLLLEEAGYKVLTARDGEEGVKVFATRGKEISAVLLDLTMPHMDGDEAFKRISAINPDVPVIMSSGYSEIDASTRFAGKKVAGFIQKPYRIGQLLAKLSEAMGEESGRGA